VLFQNGVTLSMEKEGVSVFTRSCWLDFGEISKNSLLTVWGELVARVERAVRTGFFCQCDSVCVYVISLAFQLTSPEVAKLQRDFLSPPADTSAGTSDWPHPAHILEVSILPARIGTRPLPSSPAFSRLNSTKQEAVMCRQRTNCSCREIRS